MQEFYEYLNAGFLLFPLFFYIIAVSFRLLDNSGYLFLKKEIIIQSSYVSLKFLKEQLNTSADDLFRQKLKQVLIYRRLHRFFLLMMALSLPVTVWAQVTLNLE